MINDEQGLTYKLYNHYAKFIIFIPIILTLGCKILKLVYNGMRQKYINELRSCQTRFSINNVTVMNYARCVPAERI